MDNQTRMLLRTAPGSIGETARAYANSYSRIRSICTKDILEFTEAFSYVVFLRLNTYISLGLNDGNLLSPPVTEKTFQPIYNFFAERGKLFGASSSDESLDNTSLLKIDLPTMILYTILLESNNKREGFAQASMNSEIMNEVLRIIHQETSKICPYQTFFSETDFIVENNLKVVLFLLDINMMAKYNGG